MDHTSDQGKKEQLVQRVIEVLRTVHDPEIPVNVYDLGLIYDIAAADTGAVAIRMTLTTPACPMAGLILREVESKIRGINGVSDVRVELVWDPPWDQSMMSEATRLELGM